MEMSVGAFCAFLGFWRLVRYFTLFLGHAYFGNLFAKRTLKNEHQYASIVTAIQSGRHSHLQEDSVKDSPFHQET